MRILHVSKYYYPYIGGVENICKYLVEGMPQHRCAVVCFSEGRKDAVESVNGIKVYRVGTKLLVARQALSLSYFTVLRRAIGEFRPDVIHFHWANPFPAAVVFMRKAFGGNCPCIGCWSDKDGKYSVTVPNGLYCAFYVEDNSYKESTLENWSWRMFVDRDEVHDFKIGTGEVYGLSVWEDTGGRDILFTFVL